MLLHALQYAMYALPMMCGDCVYMSHLPPPPPGAYALSLSGPVRQQGSVRWQGTRQYQVVQCACHPGVHAILLFDLTQLPDRVLQVTSSRSPGTRMHQQTRRSWGVSVRSKWRHAACTSVVLMADMSMHPRTIS